MFRRVDGLPRIELSVAFSIAGASTAPNCASLDTWAIAVGKMRPTAAASCSGSSTTSLSRASTSISRPSSTLRSCSRRRSIGRTPLGCAGELGSRWRATSARSPASSLRSIPGSPAKGRTRSSSVSALGVLTAFAQSGGHLTARRFDGAPAGATWSGVLVQASSDLEKQTGEQIPIGFDVVQLGEHLLDRVLNVLVPAPEFIAQRLHLLCQAVGLLALEPAHLFRD